MAEVVIPGLHKFYSMIIHQSLDSCEFHAGKTVAALQTNRIEPEFADPIVPLNMDVGWFVNDPRLKEQSVGAEF